MSWIHTVMDLMLNAHSFLNYNTAVTYMQEGCFQNIYYIKFTNYGNCDMICARK